MPPSRIHPGLRDRVVSIAVFDSDGGENHVLPGANAVLGLQLSGHVHAGERRLSRIGVTGIQQTLRTYGYAPVTRSVLVRFTPQGAACFGVPASELASRNVGLEDLVGPIRTRAAMARIDDTAEPTHAISIVEQLLLSMPFDVDRLVERALVLLGRGGDEDTQVSRVARTLALSERQLERRFRDRIGMSPRRFVSLRRFERAVELATSSRSLTRAAVEAGYYDQPHFNREFRRFTGVAPSAWLRMSDPYK
ncbi:MAG: helix-turn-helix domain-containing protein [Kofleriaceae bacterium]